MTSSERTIGVEPPAAVEARLTSLEDDARRLRAEVEALQDDLRWLAGDDGNPSWLARGWVRASLLLATVGAVALVSVPYLSHLLDSSGRPADPAPVADVRSAQKPQPVVAPSAALPTAPAREYIPAPVRVRGSDVAAPTRVAAEERPTRPTRPAVLRERAVAGIPAAAPGHDASPRSESP
jgi:hypothetical protein